ncbi:SAM-dependent methyltransferase [Nocardia sp. NPDC003693]
MSDVQHPAIRTDVPHSARIWNYWLGGKDNYEIDRTVGDASLAIDPDIRTMAVESRQFLIRAVRTLAGELGVRQFLDIGSGLPVTQNTHEIAQEMNPRSRVVYVDNDPLVLAHGRALLSSGAEGAITFSEHDFHEPDQIVADARKVLDFGEPIAVMFMGVLGHARGAGDLERIVGALMAQLPAGSYLALWDGTTDSDAYVKLWQEYGKSGGVPYIPRPKEQLLAAFEGLRLLAPGFVPISRWGIEPAAAEFAPDISAYGGLARKP